MRNFFILILIPFVLLCFEINYGQRKPSVKRKLVLRVPPVPQPKIEVEEWKDFSSGSLNFKATFPKVPTLSENAYMEFQAVAVKSFIVQTYINGNYFMAERREYPKNFLPKRNDLGASYAVWLKTYILNKNKIISEKIINFGQYKLVEFVYQQTETDILIHRAVVAGRNLYQLIVQLDIKKPDNLETTIEKNKEKIDKFFNSFEIFEQEILDNTAA